MMGVSMSSFAYKVGWLIGMQKRASLMQGATPAELDTAITELFQRGQNTDDDDEFDRRLREILLGRRKDPTIATGDVTDEDRRRLHWSSGQIVGDERELNPETDKPIAEDGFGNVIFSTKDKGTVALDHETGELYSYPQYEEARTSLPAYFTDPYGDYFKDIHPMRMKHDYDDEGYVHKLTPVDEKE